MFISVMHCYLSAMDILNSFVVQIMRSACVLIGRIMRQATCVSMDVTHSKKDTVIALIILELYALIYGSVKMNFAKSVRMVSLISKISVWIYKFYAMVLIVDTVIVPSTRWIIIVSVTVYGKVIIVPLAWNMEMNVT